MSTVASGMTVEGFLALPEKAGVKRELIHGELVEEEFTNLGMGGVRHEQVKINACRLLWGYFLKLASPASVASETMYHLKDEGSLQPDVSVLLSGKLDPEGTGTICVAPDIAIEVVTSGDAVRLQQKIAIYLKHGARAVWVVYTTLRFVDVYRKGSVTRYESGQTLEEPELLPGFSAPVDALFEGV